MLLNKLEQSGFSLILKSGYHIVWDIGRMSQLPEFGEKTIISYFLVSHMHYDHFSVEQVAAYDPQHVVLNSQCAAEFAKANSSRDVVQVKAGDKLKLGDELEVTFFDVDHGPNAPQPLENLGFLIHILTENIKIYFAGDMFYPSGLDVSELDVDYALLPVGGFYTFGPQEALNFANSFKSIKHIFPMHYEKAPETKQQFIDLAREKYSVIEGDYVS